MDIMATKPVIQVIDDDPMFLTAIERLLHAWGYEVRTYDSAGAFLLTPAEDQPGCILLDIQLPGPSGLELQRALNQRLYRPPIIFLTGHGDIPSSVRAIKDGAVDFLTKPVKSESLLAAVENALKLDLQQRTERERLAAWQARMEMLTARERQVFDRVVAGKPNKQIAAELGTSERTIKAHRAHLMEKLKIHSVAELVHIAENLNARPR